MVTEDNNWQSGELTGGGIENIEWQSDSCQIETKMSRMSNTIQFRRNVFNSIIFLKLKNFFDKKLAQLR